MNSANKWNTIWHKLLTTLFLLLFFICGFVLFLSYFNSIYKVNPKRFEIIIKQTGSLNVSSLIFVFGSLALIGSLVRVIYDFIGHCCYTEKFDFKIWWPWYIFRPILGFILGSMFVVIFDKSIFVNSSSGISKFPFILSFITGFAVTDAVTFLRELSKRIFGIDKGNKN